MPALPGSAASLTHSQCARSPARHAPWPEPPGPPILDSGAPILNSEGGYPLSRPHWTHNGMKFVESEWAAGGVGGAVYEIRD